jgi:hypothetical protein
MSWLQFLKKRKTKATSAAVMKVFFLKQPGTNLYVHPAGAHVFDNSAYALKDGRVGAICVTEEQVKPFFQMFLEEGSVQLATEEITPNRTVS